jgi:Arc/MetJ family transcription regulator
MMLMRTTLTLDDDLLRLAKRRAAEENRSLKEVVNDALRAGLHAARSQVSPPFTFKLRVVRGRLMPGLDLTDRDKLFDVLDGR